MSVSQAEGIRAWNIQTAIDKHKAKDLLLLSDLQTNEVKGYINITIINCSGLTSAST